MLSLDLFENLWNYLVLLEEKQKIAFTELFCDSYTEVTKL